THADKDHIGGFPDVFNSYHVENVMTVPHAKKTADFAAFYDELVEKVSTNQGKIYFPQGGEVLQIGSTIAGVVLLPLEATTQTTPHTTATTEAQLSAIFALNQQNDDHLNDLSIGLFLYLSQVRILLTADQEELAELALVAYGLTDKVDIQKAGHHGSKTSSMAPLLAITQPEYAVISSGAKNTYGHPAEEVLKRYQDQGSQIIRTDTEGNIEFVIRGEKYWLAN
nr:hypothetical protein [bacterium]